MDLASPGVVVHLPSPDPLEQAELLPGLESFVQDAWGETKPTAVHGFPLAAGPDPKQKRTLQIYGSNEALKADSTGLVRPCNVPAATDNSSIRDPGAATTLALLGFGKNVLNLAPARLGELEV